MLLVSSAFLDMLKYMKTLVNMSVTRQSCGTWQSSGVNSNQVSPNIEFPTPNLGEIGTAMSKKGI